MLKQKLTVLFICFMMAAASWQTALAQQEIYWVEIDSEDFSLGSLEKAGLDGSNPENLRSDLFYTIALVLDTDNEKLYWNEFDTTTGLAVFRRADLDGTNEEILFTDTTLAYYAALDVDRGKIYWATRQKIFRSDLDGSNGEKLWQTDDSFNQVTALKLDLKTDKVYWAFGANRIACMDLNGDNMAVIHSSLVNVSGIALDTLAGKVYWAEEYPNPYEDEKIIRRSDLSGSNVEDMFVTGLDGNLLSSLALDLDAGKIYWTDNDAITDDVIIQRANLDGTEQDTLVSTPRIIPNIALGLRPAEIVHCFTVTNTNDSGEGSLRQAILDANATANINNSTPDTIKFDIPGSEAHIITPLTALPAIRGAVVIDGSTQPGNEGVCSNIQPNRPAYKIILDGNNGAFDGLALMSDSDGSAIYGLNIRNFGANGILIERSGQNHIACNFIGTDENGTAAMPNGKNGIMFAKEDEAMNSIGGNSDGVNDRYEGNLISGNGENGIRLSLDAQSNHIAFNIIGLDKTGTAILGNGLNGILAEVESHDTVIGTNSDGISDDIESNLISGNGLNGINLTLSTLRCMIAGNRIGTDISGTTALGNGYNGINIDRSESCQIGTDNNGVSDEFEGNLISGNGRNGIQLMDLKTSVIAGNRIGTALNGSHPLGNVYNGIFFSVRVSNNTIGGTSAGAGNIIAYNGSAGILLVQNSGNRNRVFGNTIFNNGKLGIDLGATNPTGNGVTMNDPGDMDGGSNNLQNFPLLTSASLDGNMLTVSGTLNSIPNSTDFRLEFFANTVCNGDVNGVAQAEDYGEGEIYLGADSVNTDASGNANFSVTLPVNISEAVFITATATRSNGSTSEFSRCIAIDKGHEFVLLAAVDIEIGGLALSDGDLHANCDITLTKGQPGEHNGDLTAVDNVSISSDNIINGDVNAGGDIDNSGTINGATNENTMVEIADLPTLTAFSAGGDDVTVEGDEDILLPPGTYGEVIVERDGILRLSSGEYFMDELDFGTDTQLNVDASGGEVIVNIVSDLDFGYRMVVSVTGGSSLLTFNSLQSNNLDIAGEATVLGTIIVPDAKVRANSDVHFRGAICAEDIRFGGGAVILSHTSSQSFPKARDGETAATALPQTFALEQNYPNPFNPVTSIRFALPETNIVTLEIYNTLGQKISTLMNGNLAAGFHTLQWDATNDFGQKVSSGVYLYKLQTANAVEVKKMILMK